MVTTEGVPSDAFNHADIKLELIPATGPRKFDFDMDMKGMLEIVPRENLEPGTDEVKLEPVDPENCPRYEILPSSEKSSADRCLQSLSKWKAIAPSTHHHCLFVSRFLQNFPEDFNIFEKQRAALTFITIGFIKELCSLESFEEWKHEQILDYVQQRRQLASLASKLLLALSPSDQVSDPKTLRDAVKKIINPEIIVCPHEEFLRTGDESSEELEELNHHYYLLNDEERVLSQLISGKVEIYPERLLLVMRLETSIENLGSKLFRTDILEVIEDYLREIREVDLPYFVTQYRITALQNAKRNLCALLVLLLPFITRSFQQWRYVERTPGSKWCSPLWTKNVLETFFKLQTFLGIILSCEIIPSLHSILSSSGLNVANFFKRIRFQQSIEYFNDRGLAEFVVARLINSISRSTTIGPRIISLGFEKLKDDQESSELIKKILQSSSSPEVLYTGIQQLMKRRPGIFSREFDDDRVSSQLDSIFLVLLRQWINKRRGIRLVMSLQRFMRNAETSILANLYLLSRLKRDRASKGLNLLEEILKSLHGWRLNMFHVAKEKSHFLRSAKVPAQSYFRVQNGSSTRNPFSYPLVADVIIKSNKFPMDLYALIKQGNWQRFVPDLINYALQKGVPTKPLFHRLLHISKPHRRDTLESASPIHSSFIYDLVFETVMKTLLP